MNERTRRFIVTTEPVNRRTQRLLTTAAAESAVEVDRTAAARIRLQLGVPLREQVRNTARLGRPGRRHFAAALLAMATLLLLFVAGVQAAWWAVPPAMLAMAAAAWLLRRGGDVPTASARAAWLDDAVLQAFDRLLRSIAAEIEPVHRERLCQIKAAVLGIVQRTGMGCEPADADTRHYVVECLRRYLPDSLTAYLAVPKAQRCSPTLQAATSAADLLTAQLQLLRDELRRLEVQAAGRASEGLLRQQRFLAGKQRAG